MSGRPKTPCPSCATPCCGDFCNACTTSRKGRVVSQCAPETAAAIVAILQVDPGVGGVHPRRADSNGHRKKRLGRRA